MTTLIEKVAKPICETLFGSYETGGSEHSTSGQSDNAARAAIEVVLREMAAWEKAEGFHAYGMPIEHARGFARANDIDLEGKT